MMALRAGARHVTCAERWLYLALLCKEVLETNQASLASCLRTSCCTAAGFVSMHQWEKCPDRAWSFRHAPVHTQ